jgi:uncharacterized membrane protein YphA (DoxX/SURF4 family)
MGYADASWLDTAGRLLIAGFFLVAGLCNLTPAAIRDHIERMGALGVPLPAAAFWFGIALQFTGIALLVAGWHADIGVICLIVFTVAGNAIFHRYWIVDDPGRRTVRRILLLDGVAIVGGLLLLLQNVR